MNWTYLNQNWVLCPSQPCGIIHFLGGAFIGTAPQIAYQKFLSSLANAGYCIITPAFIVQPNHDAIATDLTQSLHQCIQNLTSQWPDITSKPIFGLGHSLGAKLQILMGCQSPRLHQGIMLMAFNNFESDRAIPFADLITPVFSLEFTPSPSETLIRTQQTYQQAQTLLIQFQTDALDSSHQLRPILRKKFPHSFMDQVIAGDHLTPVNINPLLSSAPVNETSASPERLFNPNLTKLEQVTLKWLKYQQTLFAKS